MKRYEVIKTDDIEAARFEEINGSPWDYAYGPRAAFRAVRSDGALTVALRCFEDGPVARITERHGPVCNDSCMEFFFSPSADCSNGYFNFEVNSNPTYLFDYGEDSGDSRRHIDGEIPVALTRGGGFWEITVKIPFSLIKKFTPDADLSNGAVIRANVYKCGKTDQPEHYRCWNPVGTPGPNFHKPEFFGEFAFV